MNTASQTQNPPEAATAPRENYRRALATEGLDSAAPGLLETLERLHKQALTPALVLRAHAVWRRGIAGVGKPLSATKQGGPIDA